MYDLKTENKGLCVGLCVFLLKAGVLKPLIFEYSHQNKTSAPNKAEMGVCVHVCFLRTEVLKYVYYDTHAASVRIFLENRRFNRWLSYLEESSLTGNGGSIWKTGEGSGSGWVM